MATAQTLVFLPSFLPYYLVLVILTLLFFFSIGYRWFFFWHSWTDQSLCHHLYSESQQNGCL